MLKQVDQAVKCKAERKNSKKAKTNTMDKRTAVSGANPGDCESVLQKCEPKVEAPPKTDTVKKTARKKAEKVSGKSIDTIEKVKANKAELAADIKGKKKELAAKRKSEQKATVAALKAKSAPSKKRGLSLEEKCCRFESHMSRTEGIFTLKELEKIGPTIGVIPQAVKDVITCLLKERRIKCEKVGASNIYWLFKRDLAESRAREFVSLTREIKDLKVALATIKAAAEELDEGTLQKLTELPAPILAQKIRVSRQNLLDSQYELMQVKSVMSICPSKYRTVSLATHALARRAANELDFSLEMNFGQNNVE